MDDENVLFLSYYLYFSDGTQQQRCKTLYQKPIIGDLFRVLSDNTYGSHRFIFVGRQFFKDKNRVNDSTQNYKSFFIYQLGFTDSLKISMMLVRVRCCLILAFHF